MDRRQTWQTLAGIVVSSVFLSVFNAVSAEEPKSAALLQTLPPDTSWVKYHVTAKSPEKEFTLTWTCRSVGQAFHGGKQCRFLEMERASETNQFPTMTCRVLVPENEFGEGKDPVGKAVKRWVKYGDREPEAVEVLELKEPLFAILLAGPKQNVKTDEGKEKLQWQQGDLECVVISGRTEIELAGQKFGVAHRVFRHKDVPFGLAGMHQEVNVAFGGQKETVVIKMALLDHGKNAKATLGELVP